MDTQVDIDRFGFIAAGRQNPHNSLRTHGAGAGIRTRTGLSPVDFKTGKTRRRINVLLIRCLVSLRGLRIATVVYEGYGHLGGHLRTALTQRAFAGPQRAGAKWSADDRLADNAVSESEATCFSTLMWITWMMGSDHIRQ